MEKKPIAMKKRPLKLKKPVFNFLYSYQSSGSNLKPESDPTTATVTTVSNISVF
jgi:hypothetical protein